MITTFFSSIYYQFLLSTLTRHSTFALYKASSMHGISGSQCVSASQCVCPCTNPTPSLHSSIINPDIGHALPMFLFNRCLDYSWPFCTLCTFLKQVYWAIIHLPYNPDFKVYNSVVSCVFTDSCNHHHSKNLQCFYHLKNTHPLSYPPLTNILLSKYQYTLYSRDCLFWPFIWMI